MEHALNISLITPTAKRSLSGNRTTAVRWAGLLGELGHRVRVAQQWPAGRTAAAPDLMVAVHAWRSAPSALAFREQFPDRPLVLLLAGTDIYRFQHSHPETTLAAMQAADRLVGLHDLVAADIPGRFTKKLRIIHQSALPLPAGRRPSRRYLDVCVVGHLRQEKDPFRTALAARDLQTGSRIRVRHLGKAHEPAWAEQARREMSTNPRYQWRGELPRWKVRQALARSHAMVISSLMEGGANVVSEAVVAGLPVIASDIPGNRGLLGEAHPAYFPASDTAALTALLERLEGDEAFVRRATDSSLNRRRLFTPRRERAAWARLLRELGE